MPDKSRYTAIARRTLSAPAAYLLEQGLLVGRVLDFGCGRGDLAKFLDGDIEQYDPHYAPDKPSGKFDVVVCNYVLNVMGWRRRKRALAEARSYVKPGGHLYVAVRRDIVREGATSKGTRQYTVKMRQPSLVCCRNFEIYDICCNSYESTAKAGGKRPGAR